MPFQVEAVNCDRDFFQGKLGNRPAFSHPKHRPSNRSWNDLAIKWRNGESIIKFGAIETGGAHPQVQEVYLNSDYTEDLRRLREDAPDSGQRPLMRGTNGHGLDANSPLEIKALTKENVRNSGGLPRIKVFDSQGDEDKLESTIDGVVESNREGHPAELQISLPYGNGLAGQSERDPEYADLDPYPDEFYLEKIRKGIEKCQKSGLDDSLLIFDLKCMVGDMDAATAERLSRLAIQQIKAMGSNARLSLHLHDAGLSKDAYVAAIKVAKEEDWPIIVDTVEGTNTGFVSLLDLDESLQEEGIDLGLTDEDREALKKSAIINDEIADDFNVKKISDALSGEYAIEYGIPGGGMAAFEAAVLQSGLAAKLNLTDEEALHVAGKGLIAAKQLMGWPFGVTPGFLRTQDASLHLINKMIEAGHITPDMSFEDIKKKVVQKLSDDQVQDFFLKNMPTPLVSFIENNKMPTEYGFVSDKLKPHPLVRKAHPLNEKPAIPSEARYYKTQAQVRELLAEGLLKPTVLQASIILSNMQREDLISADATIEDILKRLHEGNVVYYKPDGQQSEWYKDTERTINALADEGLIKGDDAVQKLFSQLEDYAVQSGVCRQIVLGEANQLWDRLEKPWMGEPDATLYAGNKPEYERAVARYRDGFNAQADGDGIEILRQHLWAREIDIETAYQLASKMIELEWHQVRAATVSYMENNPGRLLSAVEGVAKDGKAALEIAVNKIKEMQAEIVADEKNLYGREFLYSLEQRQAIAVGFFRQEVQRLASELGHGALEAIVDEKVAPSENGGVPAHMPGLVSRVLVEEGQAVKAGEPILVLEAMKMEHHINAERDGVIKTLNIKDGESVDSAGDILFEYETGEYVPNAIEQRVAELKGSETTAVERLSAHLDENAPKSAIGYGLEANDNVRGLQPNNPYVELVINRTGCNAKIAGDLDKAGYDAIMLYTRDDQDTPVISEAAQGRTRQIRSYTDHEEMIETIRSVMDDNPGKVVRIHPGWGFLSEDHVFAAKFEQAFADSPVTFVGPSSEAMKLAGDKYSLRAEVADVAPDYNPDFFENEGSLEDLRAYVQGGFDAAHPIDVAYRRDFDRVMGDTMHGHVINKAVAGGGGKGIEEFKNDGLDREANYRRYVATVLKNRDYAFKNYNGNDTVLTERFVDGNAHHVEVQFAATNGNAMMLGYRDCTLQQGGQKLAEMNIIAGDYTPRMMAKIREAGELITQRLAEKGYEGVGTLEMLALPEKEEVIVLEVNTRLQVEHGVTEGDIKLKTRKDLSLPVLNSHLLTNEAGKTPQEIVAEVFDLSETEQATLLEPGTERYGQYRLNAKTTDLEHGEPVKPTEYHDTMWPKAIADYFREKFGVEIIHGGKGAGNMDSQFGGNFR